MDKEEYQTRFMKHIYDILVESGWDEKSAGEVALAEWEAIDDDKWCTSYDDGFENDPEGSADESMSYWDGEV